MADDIIDLGPFLERRAAGGAAAGTMALWGAEGERSRFALPLWRIAQLAGAERAAIFWASTSKGRAYPFVVLDTGRDPARLELPARLNDCEDLSSAKLHQEPNALVVCLGDREGRTWGIVADGGAELPELTTRNREDILFLAGECAGLLFLRDFADDVEE